MSAKKCKNKSMKFPKIDIFFPEKKMLNSSSYSNVKTKEDSSLSFITTKKEKTKIIWSEGGQKILLTGSFCNWDKFYLMKKDKKDEYYYYILSLPKGFHQFKFKVDGKWKNSSIYPIYNNKGEKNNYLDNTSSYEYTTSTTVESSRISSPLNKNSNKDNKENNNNNYININVNVNKNIDFNYSKNNYCNYYPKINEMRVYADKKPSNFQNECFLGVNQIQNQIGNKDYLFLKENDIFSGNYTSKNIERKEHIFLNHFFLKNKNESNNFIDSIVIKYRHKNCTFLYYK